MICLHVFLSVFVSWQVFRSSGLTMCRDAGVATHMLSMVYALFKLFQSLF